MICNNCGRNNDLNNKFCSGCGMVLNNNQTINQNVANNNNIYNQNIYNQNVDIKNNKIKREISKKRKITIISLLSILLILIILLIILFINSNKTRTVMIYLDGSNLESQAKIVTSELDSINPSSIDLNKTNILIYTGGTEKWHNFISNEENAIYILKSNGFEKIKTYDKKNMGDPNTLTEFLEYSYENYKASEYNLVFYDHGGAIDGAIYDDFTSDNLSLSDMNTALNNSPFNEKNKLQTVVFRTCLNGTVEIASLYSKYAKYLIASEEITRGSKYSNVLSFLNNIEVEDDGIEFGKKFVNRYYEQMDEIDPYGMSLNTYSIVDLSKINKVIAELNSYFGSINVNKYYNLLSQSRSKMYQYGDESKVYDMVDLYELVKTTKDYATKDNNNLLNAINDAVIYNNSNMDDSYGLSIYFPFYSDRFLGDYRKYKSFNEYNKFITTFNNIKNGNTDISFSFSKEQIEEQNKNEIKYQLTEEQYNNLNTIKYYIFKRDQEHPNYFFYIYLSNNVNIDNTGLITIPLDNIFVKMKDSTSYQYIPVTNKKNGNKESLTIPGILYDNDLDVLNPDYMSVVTLSIKEENNKLFFGSAKLNSHNDILNGTLVKLEDYEIVSIIRSRRRLLDDNGNFIKNIEEWESSPVAVGIEAELKNDDVSIIKSKLDEEGEYYCVFEIVDVNNNSVLSDLIRIGE